MVCLIKQLHFFSFLFFLLQSLQPMLLNEKMWLKNWGGVEGSCPCSGTDSFYDGEPLDITTV